jgi:hypothetical protein
MEGNCRRGSLSGIGEDFMKTAPFKRIVTGHNATGKAIIAEDGPPPRVIDTGATMPLVYELWSTRESPARVSRLMQEPAESPSLPPPPGGTRARIIDFPPDSLAADATRDDIRNHFEAMGGHGIMDESDAPHKLMHRTQSVDIAIVLEGEIYCIVDEGESLAKAGDVIVQCGTNHAWSNRTDKICRMAFFMIDGKFDGDIA